jgi:hypothetical protein
MGPHMSLALGLRPGGFGVVFCAHQHDPKHALLLCAYLSLGYVSLCWGCTNLCVGWMLCGLA